jgi:N-hydroxyarylamine O-acetyltransferase
MHDLLLPPAMNSTPRPQGRSAELLAAYLKRLGIDEEPPSVEALFRIFRAHVERVPYETTWLHMGEQWDIDPDASMERVALRGRGGYCYHLNGALSRLLALLGYDVSYHVGGVHGPQPSADDLTNHLVLVVNGLPSRDNPDGDWYVDVGLGDALYEPLPLRAGTYHQAPNTFVLEETPDGIGDWHFIHDPQGSFAGMNFRSSTTELDAFETRHKHLSTSPESGFVRTVSVQRRLPHGVSILRALTFTARDSNGTTTRIVTDRNEWFALIADELLVDLDTVDESARDRLWASACAAHAARDVHT